MSKEEWFFQTKTPQSTRSRLGAYYDRCSTARRPTIIVGKFGKGSYGDIEMDNAGCFARPDTTTDIQLRSVLGLRLEFPGFGPGESYSTARTFYCGKVGWVPPRDLGETLASIVADGLPFLIGSRRDDPPNHHGLLVTPATRLRPTDWDALAAFYFTWMRDERAKEAVIDGNWRLRGKERPPARFFGGAAGPDGHVEYEEHCRLVGVLPVYV